MRSHMSPSQRQRETETEKKYVLETELLNNVFLNMKCLIWIMSLKDESELHNYKLYWLVWHCTQKIQTQSNIMTFNSVALKLVDPQFNYSSFSICSNENLTMWFKFSFYGNYSSLAIQIKKAKSLQWYIFLPVAVNRNHIDKWTTLT